MSEGSARDIIVTGIPRSGTTLTAALIDSLPDTVCLNEPLWHTARVAATPEDFAKWLIGDFTQLRGKLQRGEPVPDRRAPSGEAVTNYYKPGQQMENTFEVVPLTRAGLSGRFTLAIKHNGPYLAVLKPLVDLDYFTVIAIVRHPVEAIASWRALSLPISRGEMPNATPYWPQMAEVCRSPIDLLEKQVKMYDLMCRRLHHLREHIHIIPYETLIRRPDSLCDALGVKADLATKLIDKPKRHLAEDEAAMIAQALKRHGRFYREFYPDL
jgi:hypothetical protein